MPVNKYILLTICILPVTIAFADPSHKKGRKHRTHHRTPTKAEQQMHLNRTLHEKGYGRVKDTTRLK